MECISMNDFSYKPIKDLPREQLGNREKILQQRDDSTGRPLSSKSSTSNVGGRAIKKLGPKVRLLIHFG
jgi:hypothetical protein